jgi:multidrug transporter EmrE-like cation transporter
METLPLGTAYGIWAGIGASGGAKFGMILIQILEDLVSI